MSSRILNSLMGLLACGATAQLAAEGSADYQFVEARGYVWLAAESGNLSYDSSAGVEGTTLEADELDLDDFRIAPMAEVGVQLPLFFDFYAGVWSFGSEGTATLSQNVVFGDQVYPIGSTVVTDMELLDIYGEIAVAPLDNEWVGLNLGLAVHWLEADMSMRDNTTQQTQSVHESIPMPALDIRARVSPPTLTEWSFEGRLHYMDLEVSDSELRFIDFMASVNYYPTELIGVTAGYRSIMWDAHYQEIGSVSQDASVDLTLGGPFIGLIAQW